VSLSTVRHLAFIMDGNRRWAHQHSAAGLYTQSSVDAVLIAIDACLKNAIPFLSLYVFSLENSVARDDELKKHLFGGVIDACLHKQHLFIERGVRVRFVGQRSEYPAAVLHAAESLEQATATQTRLELYLLFYYGGRQEIVAACVAIAYQVAAGTIQPSAVDNALFESYLSTAPVPSPDLIIRTGGAQRLSNFLLYQAAYSELMFLDCLWPDITTALIEQCLAQYSAVKRNFGK